MTFHDSQNGFQLKSILLQFVLGHPPIFHRALVLISHSPKVSFWNFTQVCVRVALLKFPTIHGCVYKSCLNNYICCCIGIYIMESKGISSLQDDTSSLSTLDAPYLMLISGNLIVSSPSTRITIWDTTLGCDFHTHFPHSPQVVNWNSTQECVNRAHLFKFPTNNWCAAFGSLLCISKGLCKEIRAVPIWYMKHA